MSHIIRWLFGALALGIAGSAIGVFGFHTALGYSAYAPYAIIIAEAARQSVQILRGRGWAVWTGAAYPYGTLHQVYAAKREARQAVDKLILQGQYAYMRQERKL